ncbi:MMPL family transporter [Desulfovibrio inopinatus]|uniref:MMPL family transporter n=1 Tax=Desulfovibrio inopinatus TaxID=102109 RepID=UPI000407DA00|nr:MMPL family transporter [Desulfovibrio inopinatus]
MKKPEILGPALFSRLFELVWRPIADRPWWVIGVGLFLALLAIGAAAGFLRLDSNQDHLVSPEIPYQRRYLNALENFGDQEYLFVVIQTGKNPKGMEQAKQFADHLAGLLSRRPDIISEVRYRVGEQDFKNKALYFAPLKTVESLSDGIDTMAPFARVYGRDPSLAHFFDEAAQLFLSPPKNAAKVRLEDITQATQPLGRLLDAMQHALSQGKVSPSTFSFMPQSGTFHYFFTHDNALLVMKVLPVKNFETMDVVGDALSFTRTAIDATRVTFPDVHVGLTGRPALHADEMHTTDKDMTRASILAIVCVGILFVLVLHGWLRPVLIVGSLVVGMAWTFGFVTLSLGSLNLLSIVFALVLVGIGSDFGVHLAIRHMEETARGIEPKTAMKTALFDTGPSIVMGAVTSVCAFYTVVGSDFTGLAELGLVGGTGILLCLVAMLTVLPALMLVCTSKNPPVGAMLHRLPSMRFMRPIFKYHRGLLLVIALVSFAGLPFLYDVHFSYNLLELQADGLESVRFEKKLVNSADESTWFAMSAANDIDGVQRLEAAFRNTPGVAKVESVLEYLPKQQEEKERLLHRAAQALAGVTVAPAVVGVDPVQLDEALMFFQGALESLSDKLFAMAASAPLTAVAELIEKVEAVRDILITDSASASRLQGLQTTLRNEFADTLTHLLPMLSTSPAEIDDLPASIRDLTIGKDGRYLVKIMPKDNIWQFDKLTTFVAALRTVDPDVTGVPVGVYESSQLMHRTFMIAALTTLVLVAGILWVYERNIVAVALNLLPLGVGLLWLLELMGIIGIPFTLANFFAVPVLIAIGVDGGVHFLARHSKLGHGQSLFDTGTPTAVTLSFATTMIGFGGLLFAHHRGLAGLGAIMVLGSFTCMAACLLVMPAVFKEIDARKRPYMK